MAKLLRASATVGGGASQVELDLKAPIASPTFTGTVAGVSATHVGLGNVDNVADASQTSVGTISSGTWEGTTVAVAQGGTGVTSKTGTGNVVLSSSPTLVTPALGTPASGVATNLTGIPAANLTGTITSGTQDAITRLGTVTSGVWEGTDVGVAHGGTGASTLTDGGVLLGSGTGAITATAVLADGEMLVGDGSTDPAIESGATLRTSIGLGNVDNTADASQTSVGTITSGTWQGTTVAVNQGGTGATTHTANNVLIGAGTGAITSIAPGADGQVLTSTGSVWQSEATAGGGILLQCLSKHWGEPLTSTTAASSDSFTTFSDLQIAITPDSGTKVLVLVQTNVSGSNYNDPSPVLALFRDSTKIGQATNTGSRVAASVGTQVFSGGYHGSIVDNTSIHYLDTHGADGSTAVTYKVGLAIRGTGGGSAFINRTPDNSDSSEHQQSASSITVMEIAQ